MTEVVYLSIMRKWQLRGCWWQQRLQLCCQLLRDQQIHGAKVRSSHTDHQPNTNGLTALVQVVKSIRLAQLCQVAVKAQSHKKTGMFGFS